jgi:molybdopterin-guanine dinucleotide biosynthesis protein A
MPPTGLQLVQPIVLSGGRSRRFGRDKLAEPVRDSLLIDRPIRALREVFGSRVAIVGECSSHVASRADLVIPDPYPGIGPIGGVLAGLEYSRGPLFVLAGDLIGIDAEAIGLILETADDSPESLAVFAITDRPQPCIGLYRPQAVEYLRQAIDRERFSLLGALPADRSQTVEISELAARNVNRPADLP